MITIIISIIIIIVFVVVFVIVVVGVVVVVVVTMIIIIIIERVLIYTLAQRRVLRNKLAHSTRQPAGTVTEKSVESRWGS